MKLSKNAQQMVNDAINAKVDNKERHEVAVKYAKDAAKSLDLAVKKNRSKKVFGTIAVTIKNPSPRKNGWDSYNTNADVMNAILYHLTNLPEFLVEMYGGDEKEWKEYVDSFITVDAK